jgi:hypothetical protein
MAERSVGMVFTAFSLAGSVLPVARRSMIAAK